jgi:hypothetical protein
MIPKTLVGSSLGSVTSWAWKNFSDDFHKIPTCKEYTLQRFDLPDFPGNNGQLRGIVVGTAFEEIREGQHASIDVLTWLEGQQVAVGYISQMGWKIHAVSYDSILDANISFNEPFSWILAAADELSILRFESLIRHGLLARGFKNAIKGKGNLKKFRDHFPGACRDIAEKCKEITTGWERITASLGPGSAEYLEQIPEQSSIASDTEMSTGDDVEVTTHQ